jgi:hypothetical protein
MKQQPEPSETEEQGIRLVKRVLLFVIAPAIITGLFTLAPKFYDYFTRPVATLSFSVVGGPALQAGEDYKRIFSVLFENNGSVALTSFEATFRTENGRLDALSVEKNSLHPEIHADAKEENIAVPRMLPGEKLLIAVMASSNTTPELTVTSRSNEVVGTQVDPAAKTLNSGRDLPFLSAAFAATSVAAMSLLTLVSLRRRISGLASFLDLSEVSKADILTYILGLSKAIPLSESILFDEHNLTYARTGDILLICGLTDGADMRRNCIKGLQALLMIPNMSPLSVKKKRYNLEKLSFTYTDEEFNDLRQATKKITSLQLRSKIYDIFN